MVQFKDRHSLKWLDTASNGSILWWTQPQTVQFKDGHSPKLPNLNMNTASNGSAFNRSPIVWPSTLHHFSLKLTLATHLLPGQAVSCAAFSQFPQCPTCRHAWLPPEREQDCLGQQPSCRSVPHERTHTGDSVNGSAQCTVVPGAAGRKKQ